MYVEKLRLVDFRNYQQGMLEFSKGINVLYGPNAIGKTNILEAIYLLSTARSHRLASNAEMIRFGQDFARIDASFYSGERAYKGEIILFPNKKKTIRINKVPVQKASDMMGYLKTVLFCPEDLRLVKGSPKDRRRMMDLGICQLKQKYFHALVEYSKVLQQRNKLLKENPDSEMLWVWDEKLVQSGTDVIWYRSSYLERLSEACNTINREICGEELSVAYNCGVAALDYTDKAQIAEAFTQQLKKHAEREKKFRLSLIGPHRDDFTIYVQQKEARLYASQGQQRTAALSLKMAELEMVKEICGESPVLLLDDVLSELDNKRQSYILEKIRDIQVIITCTDAEKFQDAQDVKKINVECVKNHVCTPGGRYGD